MDCSDAPTRKHGLALFALVAVLAVCTFLMIDSSDESSASSGSFGDITWDCTGGQLTLTGSGPMAEWSAPDQVPWYSERADIDTITVADGITTIGNYAFYGCQITSFVIPDSVTTLGKECFSGCDKMTSLTIGSGVTNLSAEMLSGCTKMNDITLTGSNYVKGEYNDAIYSADRKDLVYYPPASSMTEMFIADGTERILANAFQDAKILLIHIPDSVNYYGDRAFYNSDAHQTGLKINADTVYVGSELYGDTRPDYVYVHLDFRGTLKEDFVNRDFVDKDGNKYTNIPADLLGKQFYTYGDDHPFMLAYTALSIRYQYADGSEAQPRIYDMMGEGLEYTYGTPEIMGYEPDIAEVSGTSDLTVRDVIVTYSNQQYQVVYYYNGKIVMTSWEYYGHTVEVQPYEHKHMQPSDWKTVSVTVVDGKFVMPDMNVYFSNIDIGLVRPSDTVPDHGVYGIAIAIAVVAALPILLILRRH